MEIVQKAEIQLLQRRVDLLHKFLAAGKALEKGQGEISKEKAEPGFQTKDREVFTENPFSQRIIKHQEFPCWTGKHGNGGDALQSFTEFQGSLPRKIFWSSWETFLDVYMGC